MKNMQYSTIALVALALTTTLGPQPSATAGEQQSTAPLPAVDSSNTKSRPEVTELTKFDLDFRAGTPDELVAAIQKAMGRHLNAIVPAEFNNVQLPALKMKNVTLPQFFEALEAASHKTILNHVPQTGWSSADTSYGFKTEGKPSDDSIWHFYVHPSPPPVLSAGKVCRFYSLDSYLDSGLTVDDITTAIQTGWKMLGKTPQPVISFHNSFHKDTRLLIAVGDPDELETISDVLAVLNAPSSHASRVARSSRPATTPAKPSEKPQADK